MRRVAIILLILVFLLSTEQLPISAVRVRSESSYRFHVENQLNVPEENAAMLVIHYPDGGIVIINPPSHPMTVPVGADVVLEFSGRVNEPGYYTIESRVVTSDLPSRDYVSVFAGAIGNGFTGEFLARAKVTIKRYAEGMRISLEVSKVRARQDQQGSPERLSFRATIIVEAPEEHERSEENRPEENEGSGELTPFTFVGTGTSTSTRSTTTPYKPGTVHWITSSTQVRELSVEPLEQEVTAGDKAVFRIETGIESPSFRVEGLPAGYRYVIRKANGSYYLHIYTHPSSYGKFDMTLRALSGGVEERTDISLVVRPKEGQGPEQSQMRTQESANTTTSTGTSEAWVTTTSTVKETSTTPKVTVVTVVRKKTPSNIDIALGGLLGILLLLLAILLLRRRG